MKKHPNANELERRLSIAANQPPVLVAFPPAAAEDESPPKVALESAETPPVPENQPERTTRTRRANKAASEKPEDDTVPISLRPKRSVLTRYVAAASERSLKGGRVVSAQQIMLEVLERGP
jgi:hypothetical protein